MIVFPDMYSPKLPEMINAGSVGILLTDTLYGIVARADNKQAVERIFTIKQRTESKPLILLISNVSQLYDPLPVDIASAVTDLWPGKNSVILPAPSAPEWLLRGGSTVAYRIPEEKRLVQLLEQTGPLVAPSANREGDTPARSVGEAQAYFGESVDFYVDGGVSFSKEPSSLYSVMPSGDMEQLR